MLQKLSHSVHIRLYPIQHVPLRCFVFGINKYISLSAPSFGRQRGVSVFRPDRCLSIAEQLITFQSVRLKTFDGHFSCQGHPIFLFKGPPSRAPAIVQGHQSRHRALHAQKHSVRQIATTRLSAPSVSDLALPFSLKTYNSFFFNVVCQNLDRKIVRYCPDSVIHAVNTS